MTRFSPLILLACLLLGLHAAHRAGLAAPLADTGQALREAAALVERATSAGTPGERDALVAAALAVIDGEPALTEWAWLREPLIDTPPDLERAKTRLAAAVDIEAEQARSADPTAQQRLRDVLASSRFANKSWEDWLPGWLLPVALLLRAFFELVWNLIRWPIDRLLEFLAYLIRSWWIVPIGLIMAVGIMMMYRFGVRSVLVRQAEIEPEALELPPTAAEALDAARRQAELQRYREACHFVLLSALIAIQERGDTRFDPSATNREHLWRAQASARPAVARALAPLVAAFDHAWYGADAVTEADYRGMLDLASRVREATT